MKLASLPAIFLALVASESLIEAKIRRRFGDSRAENKRKLYKRSSNNQWTIRMKDDDTSQLALLHGNTVYQTSEGSPDFDSFAKETFQDTLRRRKLAATSGHHQRKLSKASDGGGSWYLGAKADFTKLRQGSFEATNVDDDAVCTDTRCKEYADTYVDTGDSNTLEIQIVQKRPSNSFDVAEITCPDVFDVMTIESFSCALYDVNREKVEGQSCEIVFRDVNRPPVYELQATSTFSALDIMLVADFTVECNAP